MKLNRITFLIIVTACFLFQAIIISYNNWTGYISINSFTEFIIRLLSGSVLSIIFITFIYFIITSIINYLDKAFGWKEKSLTRFSVEFSFVILFGFTAGAALTFLVNIFLPYEEELTDVYLTNTIISSVVSLFIAILIEAVLSFKRSQETLLIAEKLEKENVLITIETLKNQLNPHFLFNSLNVLLALVKKDQEKASAFIEEFSSVYRYTLDVLDKPVVSLKEELNFANSYFYLQKIRFGETIKMTTQIDGDKLQYYLPPLAVQVIIENAIKHNKATDESMLTIQLFSENNYLVIKNNLQLKSSDGSSKGIGLKNLKSRYNFLCDEQPEMMITDTEYIVKLPLIEAEL